MDTNTLDPPIRRHSVKTIRRLLDKPSVNNHQLQRLIAADPALAFHVYREVGRKLGDRAEPVASIGHALSLAGVATIEELLKTCRRAEDGPNHRAYLTICSRSMHAVEFARAWAEQEQQSNLDEVLSSAVLQHLPEVIGLDAGRPEMPLEEAIALRVELATRHHFPYLSQDCAELTGLIIPRARNVLLACELARLGADGWYREDTLQHLEYVAEHLHVPLDKAIAECHRQAVDCAHASTDGELDASAFELAAAWPAASEAAQQETPTLHDEVMRAMHAMHTELGLQRVAFALLNPRRTELKVRFVRGADDSDPIRQGALPANGKSLFNILLQKPQAVWVRPENAEKYRPYLPPATWIDPSEFVAVSLFVDHKPIGLFYADTWADTRGDMTTDSRAGDPPNDRKAAFQHFQQLCRQVSEHMMAASNPDGS